MDFGELRWGLSLRVEDSRAEAMIEISGTRPENLPAAEPISQVKKTLKHTSRNLKKIDDRPAESAE
jgi:hypothetical protein